jgi:hypothetical protein
MAKRNEALKKMNMPEEAPEDEMFAMEGEEEAPPADEMEFAEEEAEAVEEERTPEEEAAEIEERYSPEAIKLAAEMFEEAPEEEASEEAEEPEAETEEFA